MKTLLVPNHVGGIIPFSVGTCDHLEKPNVRDLQSTTFGKIFKNGQLAWLANGASLEVVSTKTGERHGTWEFGVDLHDNSVLVTCVAEVKGNNWSLIIGTDNGLAGGFVCIYDIKISRVVKTIAFPQKVTSLELISCEGGANPNNLLLCQELRYMYGVVAVGTEKGNIYLLDLMFDDLSYSDELDPSKITFITSQTPNIPNKREDASLHNRHLALHLNGGPKSRKDFHLYTSANDLSYDVIRNDAHVSALLYVHQNAILIAGFSFGSFQIWNLDTLQIVHSSGVDIGVPAVIKFAFQEPENDPRNFCYLWVIRGQSVMEAKQDELANASLYSLAFDQKKYIDLFGYYYQDLSSCCLRFDFVLNHDIMTAEYGTTASSRLISCRPVTEDMGSFYGFSSREHGANAENTSIREDSNSGNGLCVFVWESSFIDPNTRPCTVLAFFDINQWYLAQMPSKIRHSRNELYPYFGFFSLTEITDKALPDFLLDVCVLPNSLSYMKTNSTAEQFFQPSSVAFDTITLIETGIIRASFLGIHRQILHDIRKKGPSILVSPQHIYDVCLFSNLLPLSGEPTSSNLNVNVQREAILSLALEYNLIDFIIKCSSDWASGKSSSEGCNLRVLQEWAWKRVHHIKTSVDRQCVPLFDCSGNTLDPVVVRHLHHQASLLKHLELIFRSLSEHSQAVPTTDQGARELENRSSVISLLALYLEVTLWFLHYGILPERMEGAENASRVISYPVSILSRIYSNRRLEIQRLSSTVSPTDVLLIDGILKNAGEAVSSLWEKDGGNGLYPPPSLHALLSIYLLPNVNAATKHQIVQYIFLDLTELLGYTPESSSSENLMKFPAAFSLSSSIIKFTQGMWLLDHRDFEEAISVLLHPIINSTDILPWQHSQIMKAFLYQGEPQKALRYARVRRPTMLTAEDVRFHLTLLLANGLVAEAYQYQKASRDHLNAEDLLQHFFLGCQQTKNFRNLLNLPLSPLEESHLIEFLHNCGDPHAREVLVIYYLQRARYVDAMCLNDQLHPRVMNETDLAARERSTTRNAIVNGFSKLMPRCHSHLTQTMKSLFKPGRSIWHQVPKPQPLSTHVITSGKAPISQTSLIETIMGKIAEIWSRPPDDYTPMKKRSSRSSSFVPDSVPLIGTPSLMKTDVEPLTQVVFPLVVNKDEDFLNTDNGLNYPSPTKRSRYVDVSPLHVTQTGKRHISKMYNSEALTLLQTPPVRRKVPSTKLALANTSSDSAPPSILKVRSLLRSQRTSEKVKSSTGLTPTPPATPDIAVDAETPECDTDKKDDRHLRFRFSPDLSEECSSISSEKSPGRHFMQSSVHESTPIPDRTSPDVQVSPRLPLHFREQTSRGIFSLPEIDFESGGSSKSSEVEDMIIDSDKSIHTVTSVESYNEFKTDLPSDVFEKSESSQINSFKTADEASTLEDDKDRNIQSLKADIETEAEIPSTSLKAFEKVSDNPGNTPSLAQNSPQHTSASLYEPVQVSVETKLPLKEKTPSPRPRTSFFSAERSKERFMQMKTEVSLELAKAGVSSAIDVEHTEIEVVEAESPLATLVKQTLDSVLCRHSEDLTHSSSSHSPLKSSTSLLTSKPLLDTMLEQPVSSDKSDLQTLPLLTVSQHETVMTESELPTDTLLPSTAVSLPEQRPHHEISLNDKSLESVNQKSMSDSTLSPVTHSSSTRRSKSPHKDVGVDSPGKKELVPVIEPLTVDVIDSFTGSSPSKKSPLRSSLSPAKSRDHSEVSKKGYSSEESPVVSANQPRYSLRKSLSPKIPSSPSPRSSKHTSSTHSLGEETESKTSPLVVTESVQCIEDSSEKLLGSQGSPIICGDEIVPPTNDDDDKVHDTGTKDSQKHSDPSLVIGEEITQNIKQYYLRCHDDRQNQSKRPSISPRSKSSRSTPSPIKSSPGKNSGSASSTPKSSNAADRDRPKVTSESPILRRKNAEGATKSASPKASPAKSPKGRSHKEASLIKTLSEDDLPSDVIIGSTIVKSDVTEEGSKKSVGSPKDLTEVNKGTITEEKTNITKKKPGTRRKTMSALKERREKHITQYQFLFCDPTVVDTADTDPEILKSPVMSTFIFSPPLTRSMSRKNRKSSDTSFLDVSSPKESQPSTPVSSKLTKSSKRLSTSRVLRLSGACETPINFVSPVLETSPGSSVKTRKSTSRLAARHSMILRKSKGALLSRRSAKLQ